MKRIAVIGAGITGLGAAFALKDSADVTLFERDPRGGGHAWTYDIDHNGKTFAVDLGFIVYNALNYPNLIGLFDALGVPTKASDMSFSVCDPKGWQWSSTVEGLFAQKRNLFSPRFHTFWRTILHFNDLARAELASGAILDTTLGTWLERHAFSTSFRENYILPMGAAIWSTPESKLLDFPARSFFQFLENHRLMHKERPKWRTVEGGSRAYVNRVLGALGARFKPGMGVQSAAPFGDKIRLLMDDGSSVIFDEVVFATHSDQALNMVRDHYEDAAFLLRSVRYRKNRIYLHRDPSLMPSRKRAWASWNVIKQSGGDICLTYWMNRLQSINSPEPVLITLNPETPPRADLIWFTYELDHPQFDTPSEAAVRGLKRIQGKDHVWFAGAWMGRGFHEDGLTSGLSAALSLGGTVPWAAKNVEHYSPDFSDQSAHRPAEARL
jgi:hypothetical protein